MTNLRKYGGPPFSIAVIHGGPGAAGEMAPVARKLSADWGVLEPIQTANSLERQVEELKNFLENNADLPATLIGFSCGAWLSCIVAARYPLIIKKLILISSGPFEEKYAATIQVTRLSRLSEKERTEFNSIFKALDDAALTRLGQLMLKTDSYDPIMEEIERVDLNADIYKSIWPQAAKLRTTGELLEMAKQIQCPVIAIHGDYDPHPADGVQKSLSKCIENFEFILVKNSGHKPWIERRAKEEFFKILKEKLRQ